MKRLFWVVSGCLVVSCVGGRRSDQAPGQGALSASNGSEDVPTAVCINDECNGGVGSGDLMMAELPPASNDTIGCMSPGNLPSSSKDPCTGGPAPAVPTMFMPGNWPSSSEEPVCFLHSPGEPFPGAEDLEPMGVVQSALAPPPCGLTITTTCNSRDVRVGVYHSRLLNVGTEAWADAYYDNAEQSGCRWGDSIVVPWSTTYTKITPWARGVSLDNDHENGFAAPYYRMDFYHCGTSSYCGTGSPSQETTSPCNGGGTLVDYHVLNHSATSDIDMYVQGGFLGGCGNLEIPRPSCAGHNYGCISWYWFKIYASNTNHWGYAREAVDYGCLQVRWCGSLGCP